MEFGIHRVEDWPLLLTYQLVMSYQEHNTGSKHPVTVGDYMKRIRTDRRTQGVEHIHMYSYRREIDCQVDI